MSNPFILPYSAQELLIPYPIILATARNPKKNFSLVKSRKSAIIVKGGMMQKLGRILFRVIGTLILIVTAGFLYVNLIYLPRKVSSEGPAYLNQKSKGRLKAESIRYIPFRGLQLKEITVFFRAEEPLFHIDKLYFNVHLWPLILRKEIVFRLDLYPPQIKKPFILHGLYQLKEQSLKLTFQIDNKLFRPRQLIKGKLAAGLREGGSSDIDLELSSPDLNVRGKFTIKEHNLYIERLTADILHSQFNFIGDVQNLTAPSLNIYGTLKLDLAGLEGLNPEYSKLPDKLELAGQCQGEIFISSISGKLQVGLKMHTPQILVAKSSIENLSLTASAENKKVTLAKLYAQLYDGEINLQGELALIAEKFPFKLILNVFNFDLHKLIKDITGKDTPLHGRCFSLARVEGPLKDRQAWKGKVWVSVSGANILQSPLFMGITDILHLPQLRKVKFKEAGGNFSLRQGAFWTEDFQLLSNVVNLNYKGYIDFQGNLSFDVQPVFARGFLRAPNIADILGIFTDTTTGSFLGEIKLKGSIRKPRYTFKPLSLEKIFPRGLLEEGLKQLFKFKKERD